MKRLLSLLLALVLAMGMMPGAAWANELQQPSEAGQAPVEAQPPEAGQAPVEVQPPEAGQAPVEAQPPEAGQAPVEAQPPEAGQAPAEAQPSEAGQAPAEAQPPETGVAAQQDLVSVTITKPSSISQWELFAYSDRENQQAEPLKTGSSSATFDLAPGEYWIQGRRSGSLLGGLQIIVDPQNTVFSLCLVRLQSGQDGWTEGTDYTQTVEVRDQDGSSRQVRPGTYNAQYASLIGLENDRVTLHIEPSQQKKAEGYQPASARSGPLTGTKMELLKALCQRQVRLRFTAPAESELLVGRQQGYFTYLYETPVSTEQGQDGLSATYTYNLLANTAYFYRVSHPRGVTYWKFETWQQDANVEISPEQLYLNDPEFTKSSVIRDYSSNGSDVANVLLNVNETGCLALEQGQTFKLQASRSWQAIEGISNKAIALPDMHYTVIDPETGAASDVVTLSPGERNSSVATLRAEKPGTALVLVTYDAMSYPGAYGAVATDGQKDPRFSAIWPENTGVFVVTVGSGQIQTNIQTNMTINQGKNDTETEKVAGDRLDSELDVLYYLEGTDGATYTFTPEPGCTVTVLHPVLTETSMSYTGGFTGQGVAVDSATGQVTLSGLTQGKHIVRVTKGGVSAYQVITAKAMTCQILKKETEQPVTEQTLLHPGDGVLIRYSGIYDPGYKLAGFYNCNVGVALESQAGEVFTGPGGSLGVYKVTDKQVEVTIPQEFTGDQLVLTGSLLEGGYGSRMGDHRSLDYELGVNPNFTAKQQTARMGSLPQITLNVAQDQQKTTVSVAVYDLAAKDAALSGASQTGVILQETAIEVPQGSTGAQVLQAVLEANHISYHMENTEYGSYLSSVNGLAAQGMSGWMLAYNGDRFDNLGLDAIQVRQGDKLELHYSLDGGTDIGAAFGGLPILTSLKLGGICVTMSKETDWSTGLTRYELVSGQNKRQLAGSGSREDPFQVTVTLPKGTDLSALAPAYTTCLSPSYAKVEGLAEADFRKQAPVALVSRTGGKTYYLIQAQLDSSSDGSGGSGGGSGNPGDTSGKISVSFRLIGATRAKEDIDLSTGGDNGSSYITWIKTTRYTLDQGATVGDVFRMALDKAGLAYTGDTNYISAITAPAACGGYSLKEMDNGSYAGWMYSVNGKHLEFGLEDRQLRDGDQVVWHYVNDYRYEVSDWSQGTLGSQSTWDRWLKAADVSPSGSSGSSSGGSSGSAGSGGTAAQPEEKKDTAQLKPAATLRDGEAKAAVTDKELSAALAQAKQKGGSLLVIEPLLPGAGKPETIRVELPKTGVENLAGQAGMALALRTSLAEIRIPAGSLKGLAGQTGGKVTVSAQAVDSSGDLRVEVAVDGKPAEKLACGLALSVPAPASGAGHVLALVNADGTETIVKKSLASGGTITGLVDGCCTVRVLDKGREFADTARHWARDSVEFVSARQLFQGVSDTDFAPDLPMSRAMAATVLYRLEDAPAQAGAGFPDVPAGSWYEAPVAWASQAGIAAGTGQGFEPDSHVTRQQLAAMLYRYAQSIGLDTQVQGDLSRFADGADTASWAEQAMGWAVGSGLLSGTDSGRLDPSGTATRGQTAAILRRLVELMVKQ